MTSPASRRAALLAHLGDLAATYRELADLPVPESVEGEAAAASVADWFAACDTLMRRADGIGTAYRLEGSELARALGAGAFTREAIGAVDPALAEELARRIGEAEDHLRRHEMRLAGFADRVGALRGEIMLQIGKVVAGRRVHSAYHPEERPGPLVFDRKE